MKKVLALLVALLAAVAVGCGGDDEEPASGGGGDTVVVSAAASLKDAFTDYGATFGDTKLSFAGSDELAAQIRQGVKPDVFASANTKLPDQLFDEGLVEKPQTFAANRLVLAVPADGAVVASVDDLQKPGIKLAVGSESVPIGSYTREVLGKLGEAKSAKILANVRSNEPDVKGIVGKLTQGAVDAGFVYFTDVEATDGALEAIELPGDISPAVEYGVAVVKGAKNPEAARRFVDGLLSGDGRKALQVAGFDT